MTVKVPRANGNAKFNAFGLVRGPPAATGITVTEIRLLRAAMAARLQPDKYVALHFALMNEEGEVDEDSVYAVAKKTGLDVTRLKSDMSSPTVDRAIDAAHKLAKAADIDGTPAFIVNGKIREGAMNDDDFAKMTRT